MDGFDPRPAIFRPRSTLSVGREFVDPTVRWRAGRFNSNDSRSGNPHQQAFKMNWEQFFSMGGYALYVWTSYGLMAAVLLINLVLPLWRKSEVLKGVARRLKQERRLS
jgi:heme exporter protein D